MTDPLLDAAHAAIAACRPEERCRQVAAELPLLPWGELQLLGAGKAAVAMARGVLAGLDERLPERRMPKGLLITKDDHGEGFAPPGLEVRFAAHPEPDDRSARAGRALRSRLATLSAMDQVIAVVSGGASALLAEPVAGLSIGELAACTQALLAGGLPIEAMNAVRKHLTAASGGRLAQACDGRVDVLVVSDVLGDDLAAIGSGPFAPDPSTYAEALEAVEALDGVPEAALRVLREGVAGDRPETPTEGCFGRVTHHVVASPETLLDEAEGALSEQGLRLRRLPLFGGDLIAVGERLLAELDGLEPGQVLVTGGEPTVQLPEEPGHGGRNQQLALWVAKQLYGRRPCRFVSLGSDGTDGPTDAAGACVDHQTWEELGAPEAALAGADAYPVLDGGGYLVRTGPTGTNVLDLHLLQALPE